MKQFLLLMLAVVALPACREDSAVEPQEPRAKITLQLELSESSIVQTRAQSTAETTVTNLWLFTFNSSGILVQKYKTSDINNDGHTAKIELVYGSGMSLYAFANMSLEEDARIDGLIVGSSTVEELRGISCDFPSYLPMWGELLNQTITAATSKINMSLTRCFSRIDVVANDIPGFTLGGIEKLLHTTAGSNILPGSLLILPRPNHDDVPENNTLKSIYLFEGAIEAATEAEAESMATAVIVKGSYMGLEGYYKLRIKYGSPEKYDIERNVIYSLNITSVQAPGFATLEEAEANYPQNVDYSVTVSDANARDLVTSNGQYYLGVNSSEYVLYDNRYNTTPNLPVVILTHNAPSSISDGTVTANGVGLTAISTSIASSRKEQMIYAQLDPSFESGTLTLRLGNLVKVVTIKKKATFSYLGGVFGDYSAPCYLQGVLADVGPMWFRFGKDAHSPEEVLTFRNPDGGLWMHIEPFVEPFVSLRSMTAYVTTNDSRGTIRFDAVQLSAIMRYRSGIPPTTIQATKPYGLSFVVDTDLENWTVKAYEGAQGDKSKPLELAFGNKFGNPVLGQEAPCSMLVSVPSNTGQERNIQFYLSSSDTPTLEIWVGSAVQAKAPAIITVDPATQLIPSTGGTYRIGVTSTHAWTLGGYAYGATITPSSGLAGMAVVTIVVPANSDPNPRSIKLAFRAVNGAYTAETFWTATQSGTSTPVVSYIPRPVLAATGGFQ